MIVPAGADSMNDAQLIAALVQEEGYDLESARYIVDVIRGRITDEEVD